LGCCLSWQNFHMLVADMPLLHFVSPLLSQQFRTLHIKTAYIAATANVWELLLKSKSSLWQMRISLLRVQFPHVHVELPYMLMWESNCLWADFPAPVANQMYILRLNYIRKRTHGVGLVRLRSLTHNPFLAQSEYCYMQTILCFGLR